MAVEWWTHEQMRPRQLVSACVGVGLPPKKLSGPKLAPAEDHRDIPLSALSWQDDLSPKTSIETSEHARANEARPQPPPCIPSQERAELLP